MTRHLLVASLTSWYFSLTMMCLSTTDAFTPSFFHGTQRHTSTWSMPLRSIFTSSLLPRPASKLFLFTDDNDDNGSNNNNGKGEDRSGWSDQDYHDALARNRLRTDVRIFLTQRSIQGLIGVLHDCRDPHTVKWMERTFNFSSLEHYHGTGALNMTSWDGIVHELMHKPASTVIIAARRRGRGHGGWSKDNPHLEDRFVEFELDIDPPSLASRLLSVRSHIAGEWVSDLETLVKANDMILDSYHQRNALRREREQERANAQKQLVTAGGGMSNKTDSLEDFLRGQREVENSNTATTAKLDNRAYDRQAQYLLENHISGQLLAPSPHRRGNFDLLVLLATQEAIHRVLRQYRLAGDDRVVSKAWLRQFYIDRVTTHFDGPQKYNRADDFLEELLQTSPRMSTSSDGKYVELVDPLRMTEEILAMRSEVSMEWKSIMESVPQEQMELQRELLMIRMKPPASTVSGDSSSGTKNDGTVSSAPTPAISSVFLEDAGSFE